MEHTIVRILSIELTNFKNIEYGFLEMPLEHEKNHFNYKADLLGIYGQNGSGKTSVIEAMGIIKKLWSGENLNGVEVIKNIAVGEQSCIICVQLSIEYNKNKMLGGYSVELSRKIDGSLLILREILSYSKMKERKFGNSKRLIDYQYNSDNLIFNPKIRYDEVIKNHPTEMKTKLEVSKTISSRNHCSFIFGEDGRKIFFNIANENYKEENFELNLYRIIHNYAVSNLFIQSKLHSNKISLNFIIPTVYKKIESTINNSSMTIYLNKPNILTFSEYDLLVDLVSTMNTVLDKIVPNMSIGIKVFGEELLKDNSLAKKIGLTSIKDNKEIPLKYESEGIIKIISILNVLMGIYNKYSMCLIIDELDEGFFEYLLGELVSVLEEGAKGQLIFTSHNLRVLEKLDKRSIIFSTANAKNRFIRFKNIKKNHNLRDTYLRNIILDGQKEEIYKETDSVEIGRAFRKIRRKIND